MLRASARAKDRPGNATAPMTHHVRKTGPWSMRPDEDLMAEYAQKGNREAFEELVYRYEREMYGYLRRYLRSAELAEDVFQTTFLQVHLRSGDFDPHRTFRPWLYRIATTRAIDLLRQNRRHKAASLNAEAADCDRCTGLQGQNLLDSHNPSPDQRLEAAETDRELRSAVDEFPARLKEVLMLVMFQGLKYQEAADTLGIPLGSVKSRLHEAVLRLRRTFMAPTRLASREPIGSSSKVVRGVKT
jgi:RNA polymerase sigma-70 factor, ECF subfamily